MPPRELIDVLRACCGGMEIGEAQSLIRDLVNVRGTNLSTEASHVGETKIVGDHNKEIRPFAHGYCKARQGEVKQKRGGVRGSSGEEGYCMLMQSYTYSAAVDPCAKRMLRHVRLFCRARQRSIANRPSAAVLIEVDQ